MTQNTQTSAPESAPRATGGAEKLMIVLGGNFLYLESLIMKFDVKQPGLDVLFQGCIIFAHVHSFG